MPGGEPRRELRVSMELARVRVEDEPLEFAPRRRVVRRRVAVHDDFVRERAEVPAAPGGAAVRVVLLLVLRASHDVERAVVGHRIAVGVREELRREFPRGLGVLAQAHDERVVAHARRERVVRGLGERPLRRVGEAHRELAEERCPSAGDAAILGHDPLARVRPGLPFGRGLGLRGFETSCARGFDGGVARERVRRTPRAGEPEPGWEDHEDGERAHPDGDHAADYPVSVARSRNATGGGRAREPLTRAASPRGARNGPARAAASLPRAALVRGAARRGPGSRSRPRPSRRAASRVS